MSSPNPNNSASGAEASNRKRPRHFHQGPDEVEEREETEAAAPPAARLYKHALESIFGFLSLKELSAVLAVSRSWSAAVGSMASIGAEVESVPVARTLPELCASRTARHIGTIGSFRSLVPLDCVEMALMGRTMSNLHTLHCVLPQPPPLPVAGANFSHEDVAVVVPITFPPSITWLKSEVRVEFSSRDINRLIEAMSRLPKLRRAEINMLVAHPEVSLVPFARCPALLELGIYYNACFELRHIEELRAIPQLEDVAGILRAPDLRLLLRPPHKTVWRTLCFSGHVDAEMAALLAAVPTLMELKVYSGLDATFLPAVSNLRTLRLFRFALQPPPLPTPEQLISGVSRPCAHLAHLVIWNSKLSASHVGALVALMPALRQLELLDLPHLDSLSFLSLPSVQRGLTSFVLVDCTHPKLTASECRHIFALQQLVTLRLEDSLSERLDSLTLMDLSAPSHRLSHLTQSKLAWAH